ncbi:restriction endonuclease subunit S [Vibrio lentus]
MNFELATLGEIALGSSGAVDGPFGSNLKASSYTESGVPVIRGSNLSLGLDEFKPDEFVYVGDETFSRLARSECLPQDIIFTKKGTLGQTGFVPPEPYSSYLVSSNQMRLRVDPKKANPKYVYYWVSSKKAIDKIRGESEHTGVPKINLDYLKKFPINLPTLSYQDNAVQILDNLNDKIALNFQTNQTLEEVAQTIFKSWFVDFAPVKAKMSGEQPEGMDAATASLFPEKLDSETGLPEGWKLSEIGDEVTVVGGGTPSKKNDDFWVDGHIHWTSPKDLSGVQDKVLLDTTSKVTEAGLKKISSGLLPVDTVLLSSRAPVGYLALAKVPMAINQGYIAMKCEKLLPPEFVIQWCVHRMDEIKQRASGSTFAEISKKSFKPISVVVPSEDTLNAYQKIVKPLYDAITSNARQNEQLSSLRDTLLPKLLSGELSISD